MLDSLKRTMAPITLSRGLEILENHPDTSEATGRWYGTPVRQMIDAYGDIAVTKVENWMVWEWSEGLENGHGYSEWTKNSYRRAVRAYFNHLVEMGHIAPPGPAVHFKISDPPAPDPKHLSEEQVGRLMEKAKSDPRDYAMVRLFYDTGARLSDLISIRVSNLTIVESDPSDYLEPEEAQLVELARDMDLGHMLDNRYRVRYKGKAVVVGKGHKGKKKIRYVFFGDEATRAVMAYLDDRPHNAPDQLFLTKTTGTPLARHSLYTAFKQVADRAGVDASPHDMRHTRAYILMRNGADARIVQEILGHEDVSTTMNQYYRFTDEELWDAYDEFA